MNRRLALGGAVAFIVIFNLGYVFHEILFAAFFKASFGPGVQRETYIIPVIFLAFVIYIALMATTYPVFHLYFSERRGLHRVKTGLILRLLFGFLWDGLQGGIIEYATYNVTLASMLIDSTYHTLEGVLAGGIIGWFYRPQA
jgi:hypothetical protein